jgi:hypothetical protein
MGGEELQQVAGRHGGAVGRLDVAVDRGEQ